MNWGWLCPWGGWINIFISYFVFIGYGDVIILSTQSIYTSTALSGNEHFDTRTLIKSTRYCVNISRRLNGAFWNPVITSRPTAEDALMPLMCPPSCVHILYMKVTWATVPLFALYANIGSLCVYWIRDILGWMFHHAKKFFICISFALI